MTEPVEVTSRKTVPNDPSHSNSHKHTEAQPPSALPIVSNLPLRRHQWLLFTHNKAMMFTSPSIAAALSCRALILLLLGTRALVIKSVSAQIVSGAESTVENTALCTSTEMCKLTYGAGYECSFGRCSNNPYDRGCLVQKLPGWNKVRVCNSDDPPDAADRGICRISPLNPMEIRISSQNWEAVFFESWILQIVLSELLDVPTTIETGTPDAKLNLYDPTSPFEYGVSNDWAALERADLIGDCRLASRSPKNYETCAHMIPEIWDARHTWVRDLVSNRTLEPPQALGVLGEEHWFLPKYTGLADPTLMSYMGLAGEENRQKLAEAFLRPTTWRDYCEEVSLDNCTYDDGVAVRLPENESEAGLYYMEGFYIGHFRATEKNDCSRNPLNCTGHIVDYPCGWTSWVTQQTYWLDIALESDGPEPGCGGYTYSQMKELWKAANATKSNIMMYYWRPEALYETFLGSDAEFSEVTMPPATELCIESRIDPQDRCSSDPAKRAGSPEGVCDDIPDPIQKVYASSLYDITYDPSIPESLISPAYAVISRFTISGLQQGDIFSAWLAANDPRDGLCEWVVQHMSFMDKLIPPTYPRVFVEKSQNVVLLALATSLGGISTLLVIGTWCAVYRKREMQAIKYAQVEFLFLLLAGLFLISLGAVLSGAPPSDDSCMAFVWLINFGYTITLLPLVVKISAINRLMHAAERRQAFKLERSDLFKIVFLISVVVLVVLVLWSVMDPPRRMPEYTLTNSTTNDGATIVTVQYFCGSNSFVWYYVAAGWNALLLLIATILALENRKLPQDFNESQTLAMMIYSHFVFVVLRVITYSLNSTLSESTLARCLSLIYSIDTIATVLIYFFPKLIAAYTPAAADGTSADYQSHRWHIPTQAQFDAPSSNIMTSEPLSSNAPESVPFSVDANPQDVVGR